jgi:hypothetical protein
MTMMMKSFDFESKYLYDMSGLETVVFLYAIFFGLLYKTSFLTSAGGGAWRARRWKWA